MHPIFYTLDALRDFFLLLAPMSTTFTVFKGTCVLQSVLELSEYVLGEVHLFCCLLSSLLLLLLLLLSQKLEMQLLLLLLVVLL